jgi:hypothetical protein
LKKLQIALVGILIVVGLFLLDGGSVYIKQLINRPPKAAFSFRTPTRTLKYIASTDRDLIMFLNNSTDPDGDKLISQWFIRYNGTGDWRLLNSSIDHWGRLSVSSEKGHEIKLVVSDGMKEESTTAMIPVDPARPERFHQSRLTVPVKGINYQVGITNWPSFPTPTSEEMLEEIEVIRNELGCNGIRIYGDNDDKIVECARIALVKKFQIILLSPRYIGATVSETVERFNGFVIRAGDLLQHESIAVAVGNELNLDSGGRFDAFSDAQLNDFLFSLVSSVPETLRGRITYARGPWENPDWPRLGLTIIGSNEYISSETQKRVLNFKAYGKVWITEFGSTTYEDATRYMGSGWRYYQNKTYSQEEQVSCIERSLKSYEICGVDAAFLYTFIERKPTDAESFGILKFQAQGMLLRRKLGFYAYQSFTFS